jgi:hypothetical protein
MNNLTRYILYITTAAAMTTCMGCPEREKSTSLNGIESKIIGIEPIYDRPKIEIIGIEPADEPNQRQ